MLLVAELSTGYVQVLTLRPPFAVGDGAGVLNILGHNLLVLALHAMACVAGFIAGSSLPLQAQPTAASRAGCTSTAGASRSRFVVCATAFSLSPRPTCSATRSPAWPTS